MKLSKDLLKTKILCGAVAGGILLSTTSIAFASTSNNVTSKTTSNASYRSASNNKNQDMEKVLESVLKEGVTSKTITQEESDKIKTYNDEKRENFKEEMKNNKEAKNNKDTENTKKAKVKGEKKDLFANLVSDGVLSKEKADALRKSMNEQFQALREKTMKENLSKLVTNKTITQEQANKIQTAMKEQMEKRKSEMEKMKTMTEEERKEYMETNKEEKVNPIDSLVKNGTITEKQEDAIKKAILNKGDKNHKHGFMKEKNNTTSESENTDK